ncbi:hypothetical protein ACFE04_003133 [Oxalis oulophora]
MDHPEKESNHILHAPLAIRCKFPTGLILLSSALLPTELLHNLHGQCQIDSNICYNALEFGAYSSLREIFVYLDPAARISWTLYLFLKKDDIKQDLEGNYDLKIYDDMDILSSLFRMHKIQLNQYVLTTLKLAIPYFMFRITFRSFVEDDRIGWIQQNS